MRTTRALIAFLISVSGLAVLASAPPADAVVPTCTPTPEAPTSTACAPVQFQARPGFVFEYTYTPVLAVEPTGAVGEPLLANPDDCATVPNCTQIPVDTIFPKGYNPKTDEFNIAVEVSWEQIPLFYDTGQVVYGQHICIGPSPCPAALAGSDLDVYFYKKAPSKEDPKVLENVYIGHAATAKMPERFSLFGGEKRYYIDIINATGVNLGFTLKLTYIDHTIEGFEDHTGDVPAPPVDLSSGDTLSAPTDFSGGGDTLPDLSPAPPIPGVGSLENFGDAAGTPDFLDQLRGSGPGANSLIRQSRTAGPAGKPSGVTLFLWLALLPIALVAAAFVVLRRLRPATLSVAFPTASRPAT